MTQRKRRGRRRRARLLVLLVLVAILIYGSVEFALAMIAPHGPYQEVGNRTEFADGACVLYSPTGPDRHRMVFVDAGHGGPDPGAEATGPNGALVQEKTLTLAVAQDLLPLLRADGYHVAMSRISDVPVAALTPGAIQNGTYTPDAEHRDVQARVDCANAVNANLLLAIHFNSYGDPSVGGVETLYDPDRPFASDNQRFAQLVQQQVLAHFSANGWTVPDRGIISDVNLEAPALTSRASEYGHLMELGPASPGWFEHPTTMPGVLCEPLFVTDPNEAAVAVTSQGQQAIAHAFEDAINRFFAS